MNRYPVFDGFRIAFAICITKALSGPARKVKLSITGEDSLTFAEVRCPAPCTSWSNNLHGFIQVLSFLQVFRIRTAGSSPVIWLCR